MNRKKTAFQKVIITGYGKVTGEVLSYVSYCWRWQSASFPESRHNSLQAPFYLLSSQKGFPSPGRFFRWRWMDALQQKIVLFLDVELEKAYINEKISRLVPEYMLPNKVITLEKMPINANGKIDRVNDNIPWTAKCLSHKVLRSRLLSQVHFFHLIQEYPYWASE